MCLLYNIYIYIVSYNRTSSSSTCSWAIESAQSSVVFVTDVTELWQSLSVLALSTGSPRGVHPSGVQGHKPLPFQGAGCVHQWLHGGAECDPQFVAVAVLRSKQILRILGTWHHIERMDRRVISYVTPYTWADHCDLRTVLKLLWADFVWCLQMWRRITRREFGEHRGSSETGLPLGAESASRLWGNILIRCFFHVAFPHSVCLKLCRVHVMCCNRKLILTFCVCAFGMHHPACNVTSLSSSHSIQFIIEVGTSIQNGGGRAGLWKTVWKDEYTTTLQ